MRLSQARSRFKRPIIPSSSSQIYPVSRQQQRTFLPFSSSLNPLASSDATPKQTLTASRTLPCPSPKIYAIIADVSSYDTFLPFCSRSTVTKWSAPVNGKKWPSEAELEVGWKGVTEKFTSRIYCIPGRVVEAIGGNTETTLRKEDIRHHAEGDALSGKGRDASVLSHLLTRWTVKDAAAGGAPKTHVDLAIEFQFANPIYSAMSSAVADQVAGYMIGAFEKRVKEVLAQENGTR